MMMRKARRRPRRPDPQMTEFEAALLRSVEQALSDQHARVRTPKQRLARHKADATHRLNEGLLAQHAPS